VKKNSLSLSSKLKKGEFQDFFGAKTLFLTVFKFYRIIKVLTLRLKTQKGSEMNKNRRGDPYTYLGHFNFT